jgi:copper chaperone NosL
MRLSKIGRIGIIIVVLFLSSLWIFPMWSIDLRAPQYPGGLSMQIWISDIKGDVDIINGLNHYIGMHTIHKADFKEFLYLPLTMLSFMTLGIILVIINRKKGLYVWALLFLIIAAISFYDFYQWEYEYGHNLDPIAPIKVPGMAYQPPLIGYKKLLNFEVLSQPHIGGWFYIVAGVLLMTVTIYEFRSKAK